MQFKVAIDTFLQFCAVERRLSSHSTQAYSSDLIDFHRWLTGNAAPSEVSTATLKDYLNMMVAERKLSASTVRRRIACLRSFFAYLSEREGAPNPFDGWRLRLPRRKQLPRALSRDEVSCLLDAVNNHSPEYFGSVDYTLSIVVRLMIATGIRVGEVCKLRADDISPDGAKVRVRGKGAKERIAYVTDGSLARELGELRSRNGTDRSTSLLRNRRNKPLTPQSVRFRLRQLAADEGFTHRITPHMLRHTAATLLIETGVDIRFVQRLLGHSSIATTELYTHVTDEALRSTLMRANVLGLLSA